MITYNPGKWNLTFALSLKGSVFPKAFVVALPSALLAAALNYHMGSENSAPVVSSALTSLLSGFTFILGFLIVFRSQVAYSRWWEGATLLQKLRGEWFNAFSSLMAFCNPNKAKRDEVLKFQHQLIRLISLLYASALQQVGQGTSGHAGYELISIEGFDTGSIEFLESSTDRCEIILQWIQRLIIHANNAEVIRVAPPILSRVYNQLGNGIVNLNNARKIAEFNIPFCLAQMITFMLVIHWCITPFMCAASVESPAMAGVLCFVVIFSFWSITYIATEIEIPYGSEPNDLPLEHMQRDLNKSLLALLHPFAGEPPEFTFREDLHSRLKLTFVNLDNTLGDVCILREGPTCEPSGVDLVTCAFSESAILPVVITEAKLPASTEVGGPPTARAVAAIEKLPDQASQAFVPLPAQPPAKTATMRLGLGSAKSTSSSEERMDGVTKVLDVFSEALVTSSDRIENHLAHINQTMTQLCLGLQNGSIRDTSLCSALLRPDVPGTPEMNAAILEERVVPKYTI